MSVIHYTPSELAAVASLAAGNTASDEGKRRLSRYLDALAAYSAANTACYVATYREQAPSWTAEDIRREVRAALMPDLIRLALSTLDGMPSRCKPPRYRARRTLQPRLRTRFNGA